MSQNKVNDGTNLVSFETVGLLPLLERAAGSKSGRRDNASATTLSRPGLYSTEKLYSAKNDNHLAIRCERWGLFTAVRNDAWSVCTINGLSPKRQTLNLASAYLMARSFLSCIG